MSDSILRQKLKTSRPKPMLGQQVDIGQYLEKAVSLAGLEILDTQIEAKADNAAGSTPSGFVEGLFDSGLNLLIQGSKAPYLGIVSLNPELVSSLTDILTGDLEGEKPTEFLPRSPTAIDASLSSGFINGVLAEIDGIFAEQRPDFNAPGFQISGREAEPSAHMFPDIPHITVTLEIDVNEGVRGGKFSVSVPAGIWGNANMTTLAPANTKPDPAWTKALKSSVHQAPAIFNAVLYRKKMPIRDVMKLKIDDVLEFPATALDGLSLEIGGGGKPTQFITARLGEFQEMRAARVCNIGPAQSAPEPQNLLTKD